MAHFKFEGDIASTSPCQLEYIDGVLEECGYNSRKVLVEAVGKAGDHYVANVKRIIVEHDGEIFKMIAKVAPTAEGIRAISNTQLMFHNEHMMYTEVLLKLEEHPLYAYFIQDRIHIYSRAALLKNLVGRDNSKKN